MFKFTSKNISLSAWLGSRLFFCVFLFLSFISEKGECQSEAYRFATLQSIINENSLLALSDHCDWSIGEMLEVFSYNTKLGAIAFVEVVSVAAQTDGKCEIRMTLRRQSRKYFIQLGDIIRRVELSGANPEFVGSTELLIYNSKQNISSKYRPLVHQGLVIGDTAQTLYETEFLINYFGNVYYGIKDWLTIGTLVPVNAFGRPNANFRAKLYDGESTTLTAGMSYVRLSKENEASLNLNFYWDATSTDSLISHTFLSLGLINWTNSEEAAALKYLTSSSFQTGYEVILDNWDRFLIGPSYNFDKKALGGYLSYIWIMDRLHIQVSLNATDVTHLRLDPTDGFYGYVDMFWRF